MDNILQTNYLTKEIWEGLIKQLEELGHHYPKQNLTFSPNYYLFNNSDKLIETQHKMNIKFSSDFVITRILKLIDGQTKTKRLFTKVREELGVDISNEEMLARFKPIYEAFNLYDALLLKRDDRIITFK